jgi:amphiphysin
MIQNALLAQYYTIMHTYCEEVGFPSPPPPMEDVIATWTRNFKPAQQQIEAINCLARGRSIQQSMGGNDDRGRNKSSNLRVLSGLGNRRPSSSNISNASTSPNPESRMMRIPSPNPIAVSPPHASPCPDPTSSYTPDFPSAHLTPSSSYSAHSAHSPAGPSADYFQRAAGKKKPPPPPKRFNSDLLYATALYSFEGQSQGDLSFNENDRIRVTKKTDSTDDWWEGELRGMRGSFPANYCKIG